MPILDADFATADGPDADERGTDANDAVSGVICVYSSVSTTVWY